MSRHYSAGVHKDKIAEQRRILAAQRSAAQRSNTSKAVVRTSRPKRAQGSSARLHLRKDRRQSIRRAQHKRIQAGGSDNAHESQRIAGLSVVFRLNGRIQLHRTDHRQVAGLFLRVFSGNVPEAATADMLEEARSHGHEFEVLAKPVHLEKVRQLVGAPGMSVEKTAQIR
jgi:hypothetical protein